MKVFLSWSGEQSHKVAVVFRDWFPSVIQSLVPYVSSEDIDKGARWSTDIATELEDSTFGILCVTKDNLEAPWLTFEAGALSKTMDKSSVCPFLFNIKRSEVNGPILQFQSTTFEKEDIKKLLKTLNKACGEEKLTDDRLDKAFDVWYPSLETGLKEILESEKTVERKIKKNNEPQANEILEEILELSRLNQKLLRSSDNRYIKEIEQMNMMIMELKNRLMNKEDEEYSRRRRQKIYPRFTEELFHVLSRTKNNYNSAQILLGLMRNDYPWIYDSGTDLIKVLKSKNREAEKSKAINDFMELLDFTFKHPMMREMCCIDEEQYVMSRELCHILRQSFRL